MKNKIATTVEQSKKLAEILPIESADMTWEKVAKSLTEDFYWKLTVGLDIAVKNNLFSYRNGYTLPCWSLAALMELLPSELELPDMHGGTIKYEIRIRKYSHTNESDLYQIAYATNQGLSKSWHDMVNTSEQEDLLDVVFEMVCYLKENKMI